MRKDNTDFPKDGYNHGDDKNTQNGGTCEEFLKLNRLSKCCDGSEDDCYMIHFNSRCYCGTECNKQSGGCCPDAFNVCAGQDIMPNSPIETIKTTVSNEEVATTSHRHSVVTKEKTTVIIKKGYGSYCSIPNECKILSHYGLICKNNYCVCVDDGYFDGSTCCKFLNSDVKIKLIESSTK